MFPFFTKFFEKNFLMGKDVIKKISFVFLIIFLGLSIVAWVVSLRGIEVGFLLSNPLALIGVLLMLSVPYLSPAFLIVLLYKFRWYALSLSVGVFLLVMLLISWQFAYKNEMFFSVYSRFSSFFEGIGMARMPEGILIPSEIAWPSGIHTLETVPYYDRYYVRANYPLWELSTMGKDSSILGLNTNVEYNVYPKKRCADTREIPKQTDKYYPNATFQDVRCRDNKTCTVVVYIPEKLTGSKLTAIYSDDEGGCVFLRVQSSHTEKFPVDKLMPIIDTAERVQ